MYLTVQDGSVKAQSGRAGLLRFSRRRAWLPNRMLQSVNQLLFTETRFVQGSPLAPEGCTEAQGSPLSGS